jgi:hypothetical protein
MFPFCSRFSRPGWHTIPATGKNNSRFPSTGIWCEYIDLIADSTRTITVTRDQNGEVRGYLGLYGNFPRRPVRRPCLLSHAVSLREMSKRDTRSAGRDWLPATVRRAVSRSHAPGSAAPALRPASSCAPQRTWRSFAEVGALLACASIGSSRPIVLRLLGLCSSWSCQFLSWSQRTGALHHRDPAEAGRRWRGRGT